MASGKTWTAAQTRQTFIDYFVERKHLFVPSSLVIPQDDPTLLFTNAGMNQFKSIFVGTCAADSPLGAIRAAGRAANSQKCIRAGGKHNDLDDVGKDTYHHTFFEMLGNWSFGDYFKEEAIDWAWDLLTNVYGLPKERLYVTYFGGNEALGLPPDEEAKRLWAKWVSPDRILPFGMKENFWEMGDTGPCGPCSEIHYDRIGNRDGSKLVNNDDPTLIEIWNLVFMQFNRESKGGKLTPLPAPCVDTGMGFERLVSVLQDVKSNYDTDVWSSIFSRVQQVTGHPKPYPPGSIMEDYAIAYRVIADHIRTLSFALADGGAPDSVGRGFVLRRIIRRAIRYGKEFLGAKVGFFSQLVDAVSESMGDAFPEIRDEKKLKRVKALIEKEERLFDETWENGMKHFQKAVSNAKKNVIAGSDAFTLHDRYGFPVDLTQLMAEKHKMKVDMEEFERLMEEQRKKSGDETMVAKRGFLGTDQTNHLENVAKIAMTDDSFKWVWKDCVSSVVAIYTPSNQQFVDSCNSSNEDIGVILDKTNFYAESGGQVTDVGKLDLGSGKSFVVSDCQVFAGYVVHIGRLEPGGKVTVGSSVTCKVDLDRRLPIAANHTSTHVLNYALRHVLVRENKDNEFDQVDQKGSLVDEKNLRFDFSWGEKLTDEQIARIEKLVNEQIAKDLTVYTKEVPQEKALQIVSLRSVFGEKYPPKVRVVSVGKDVDAMINNPTESDWMFSVELCGGTHLPRLGLAELATVVAEQSLGGNTRRMVMYTRDAARKAIAAADAFDQELTAIMKGEGTPDEKLKKLGVLGKNVDDSMIPVLRKSILRKNNKDAVDALRQEQKELDKKIKDLGTQIGEKINGEVEASKAKFIVRVLNKYEPQLCGEREAMLEAQKVLDKKAPSTAVMLLISDSKKGTTQVLVTVPAAVQSKLSAVEWLKETGVKGGGKPLQASGAGLMNEKVESVLEVANKYAGGKLQ